jgi:ABC-type Fe3+-hydroxamate transport system substrate-binding protein
MVLLLVVPVSDFAAGQTRTIIDKAGRKVTVPVNVNRVICSDPGALRLLTYLRAQNLIVAVDDIEVKRNRFDARPYALANPEFTTHPIFGEFRGFDNPELILSLAYFIGKVLYPQRFKDVEPAARADEIYEFLVGRPVFNQMNALFKNMAFQAVGE